MGWPPCEGLDCEGPGGHPPLRNHYISSCDNELGVSWPVSPRSRLRTSGLTDRPAHDGPHGVSHHHLREHPRGCQAPRRQNGGAVRARRAGKCLPKAPFSPASAVPFMFLLILFNRNAVDRGPQDRVLCVCSLTGRPLAARGYPNSHWVTEGTRKQRPLSANQAPSKCSPAAGGWRPPCWTVIQDTAIGCLTDVRFAPSRCPPAEAKAGDTPDPLAGPSVITVAPRRGHISH